MRPILDSRSQLAEQAVLKFGDSLTFLNANFLHFLTSLFVSVLLRNEHFNIQRRILLIISKVFI